MSRTRLAALTLLALAACGRGEKSDVASADSLNRDLQLAPVDTSAALNDQPGGDTATVATATPAPAPAAAPKPAPKPKPKPKPAAAAPAPPAPAAPAPARLRLRAASPPARASRPRRTPRSARNKNKVGDQVTATVANDVKDAAGRVVIPAGSQVTLQVTAIKESENKGDTTGTLTLKPTSIAINGVSKPLPASISGVTTKLEGRKTNAGDIAKVGVGTGVGAVVGRVIGGSTQGRDHRRHHRRRGRHPARDRDQGPRCGGPARHHRDVDAG